LRAMDQQVRVAYGGNEAVDVAEKFRPDVIFMDVSMPDLSGLEAVRRIREKPWAADVLICVLSGHGQQADRVRSAEAGADMHRVKPVRRSELTDILSRKVRPKAEDSGKSE